MRERLVKPTCAGCPHNYYHSDRIPQKKFGVMMHCGEHYCTGGKRARRFKRGDPKIHVPQWCPKRKDPCELRIYALKSKQDCEALRSYEEGLRNDPVLKEREFTVAHFEGGRYDPWPNDGQEET